MSNESQPLLSGGTDGRCLRYSKIVLACLVYIFTCWPVKSVKTITKILIDPNPPENQNQNERRTGIQTELTPNQPAQSSGGVGHDTDQSQGNCSLTCLIRLLLGLLHISFIIIGVVSQIITCFSRQNPYAHWVHDPNDTLSNNNSSIRYCLLKCEINKNFVTGFIFPDAIIALLALWIYLKEPIIKCIANPLRDFLKIKTEKDTRIEELIDEVVQRKRRNRKFRCTSLCYVLISIGYIISSLSVGIFYLHAFGIIGKNESNIMIALSFFGFLAFDLLYIQVIMWYAYQCTLLVYYLDSIKSKLTDPRTDDVQNPTPNLTKDDVEETYGFLKQLNASSGTTQMVIVIAGFTAISCVINLFETTDCPMYSLNKEANSEIVHMQIKQVTAVAFRTILWMFVVIFPFHKAAQVNEASRKLSFKIALYHPEITKGGRYIASEIRLIGIRVYSWLPYVVILVITFVIMIGSNIISYIHFL